MSTTSRTEQTLYIVRHGTAYHNVSNAHDDLTDPKWIDPALTPHGHGHGQAEITGMALQSSVSVIGEMKEGAVIPW